LTYTKKQVDKILELRINNKMGSDTIARKLKLSRNPVRNVLRRYGLLPYPYPPDLGTGPPSFLDPSTWSINKPKLIQPGGWLYKEIEKKKVTLENAYERIQTLEQQVNDTNQNLDQKNHAYEKLTQEHATTIKKLDESNKKNIEYEKEIEEKNQIFEDIRLKLQEGLSKINNIFSEMRKENETWKTKYNTSQEEIKTLQKEIQDYREKETRRQTPEPPQNTWITDESETPIYEEKGSSITIEWPLLATVGIIGLGIITLIYVATKKPMMPLTHHKTVQPNFPYIWYYDREKEIWILYDTNGNKLISDNVITKIQQIKNRKITDVMFFVSTSDYPVNTNTEYITVAYGKNASYAVPLSPGWMIQSGPLRVSPCEWGP
jgi:hypothetical protein